MDHLKQPFHSRRVMSALIALAALAGITTTAWVGVALAKTFTLQLAKARVTNQSGRTTSESIVVTSSGRAVYTLSGDSKTHQKCTRANGCFSVWPPVTVSSAKQLSKGPGVPGKVGLWHRSGLLQVTLNGHPLYRFAPDDQRAHATGEGLVSFGGTWHVVRNPM